MLASPSPRYRDLAVRIHFERSGGFAGIEIEISIETDDLPTEEAQEVERLIEICNFFALPVKPNNKLPWPDQFQYKITIESEDMTHAIEISDSTAPQEMQPLLQKLTMLALSPGSPDD